MKCYRKKRGTRKRGGQSGGQGDENTKPNYYNKKVKLMEEGNLGKWYIAPTYPTIKSTSNPSLSQQLRQQYDLEKNDEKRYKDREKLGLTFGGKTKRRRRRSRRRKLTKRKNRR